MVYFILGVSSKIIGRVKHMEDGNSMMQLQHTASKEKDFKMPGLSQDLFIVNNMDFSMSIIICPKIKKEQKHQAPFTTFLH